MLLSPSPPGTGWREAPGEVLRAALLLGSRRHEVRALLPPMLDAIAILKKEREVGAFVIQAPTISSAELLNVMQHAGEFARIVPPDRAQPLPAPDVALSSSRTPTLQYPIPPTPH